MLVNRNIFNVSAIITRPDGAQNSQRDWPVMSRVLIMVKEISFKDLRLKMASSQELAL